MTDQRTAQQNKALHKYLTMLSEDLNSAGLDIRRTMAQDFEISWTPETAKELIWRQVQRGLRSRGFRPGPLVLDPSQGIDSEHSIATLHTWMREAVG